MRTTIAIAIALLATPALAHFDGTVHDHDLTVLPAPGVRFVTTVNAMTGRRMTVQIITDRAGNQTISCISGCN